MGAPRRSVLGLGVAALSLLLAVIAAPVAQANSTAYPTTGYPYGTAYGDVQYFAGWWEPLDASTPPSGTKYYLIFEQCPVAPDTGTNECTDTGLLRVANDEGPIDPGTFGSAALTTALPVGSVGWIRTGVSTLPPPSAVVADWSEWESFTVEAIPDTGSGGTGAGTTFGDGDDSLYGTNYDDSWAGGLGDDSLWGEAGDDDIWGGFGEDKLYGGDGIDSLWGDDGLDSLWGGDDFDTLYGGGGTDYLWGELGDDWLYGGEGLDWLYGGSGMDELRGELGDDWLYGGAGLDALYGGGGDDELDGGNGNDDLNGGGGDDDLLGGAGNDDLDGGAGNDDILDRIGRDIVTSGGGNDRIDVFDRESSSSSGRAKRSGRGKDVVNCGKGKDTVFANVNDKVAKNCEIVIHTRAKKFFR
jgi:hypothetical protein